MTVKVVVVGYGNMGKNHVRVLSEMPDVEIIRVIEPDHRKWPIAVGEVHSDLLFEFTLQMQLAYIVPDAVIIASPTRDHYRSALAAIEAGCHVLVEKPFTETIPQGIELMTKTKIKQILMVGLIERFNPAVVELKRWLDMEVLVPQLIEARRSGLVNFTPADGVTSDLATHDIDIINYLVGETPDSSLGFKGLEGYLRHEAVTAGVLHYPGGAIGVYTADWLSPTKVRKLRVVCNNGTFFLDYINQTLDWHPVGFDPEPVNVKKAEPLVRELRYFIDHIESGLPDEMQTTIAALNALQIVRRVTHP